MSEYKIVKSWDTSGPNLKEIEEIRKKREEEGRE